MPPLKTLDVMQMMSAYVTLAMSKHHEHIKETGGDVARDQRHAEDHFLATLAGMYVTFAATFNQTTTRAELVAAVERQAIVFEHQCDEYVGQVLVNLDNLK